MDGKYTHKAILLLGVICLLPRMSAAFPMPELYPNKHLESVGQEQAQQDIGACQVKAQNYLGDESEVTRKDARRATARTAARGAAAGALAGAITKNNVGRSTGAGAAVGGLAGLVRNRRHVGEATPEYKKFVESCLEDKGYKVLNWK